MSERLSRLFLPWFAAAVALALGSGVPAQERLAPVREPDPGPLAKYETDLQRVFTEAFGEDVALRAIVRPSFNVEYAVGIRRGGDGYEIFSLTPSVQIWSFQARAMMRSGEMGVIVMDAAADGDPVSGIPRDGSGQAIARLDAQLPDDPAQVSLTRCSVAIDAEVATVLADAWQRMLEAVRPDDEPALGLDGTTYQFSMEVEGRRLRGQAWSPEPATASGRLTAIAESMRDYCAARREDTLRRFLESARNLSR
jgi:hypothetical protein